MEFDLTKALGHTFDCRYFGPDEAIQGQTAIPYVWVPGSKDSRMALVLGDNAGGKSFFRRLFQSVTYGGHNRKPGPYPVREMIHLSMEARAGHMMYGMARAVVYGDEERDATGQLTASTIEGAIQTSTGRDHDVIVYWDEPDIGMSARSAAGAGIRIRDFTDTMPNHIKAVMVTSHSPELVERLAQAKETPHYLFLGDAQGPATVTDWIKAQRDPVPVTPDELAQAGRARFKLIQGVINDIKSKKVTA